MLRVTRDDVSKDPFPHVISTSILEPEFYHALKADFPTEEDFERQRRLTGTVGSRTGVGYDIYRGDQLYQELIDRSPAWSEFDRFINSDKFVRMAFDLFGEYLDDFGCLIGEHDVIYDGQYLEPRETMTPAPTIQDRIRVMKRRLFGRGDPIRNHHLFTRLDIHKATLKYSKRVHCDRPNRLCSLIIYFCNAIDIEMVGGDLELFRLKRPRDIRACPRHLDPREVETVRKIKPADNLGLFFLCCNNSYHGVGAVKQAKEGRDYLYINISIKDGELW